MSGDDIRIACGLVLLALSSWAPFVAVGFYARSGLS